MNKFSELKFWLKQALWFVPCAYVANFVYAVYSDQTGGTFGDTFGAANALFSGTALLMLVLAVILQREELEHVKDERNDTKTLLKGQETINKLQSQSLKQQIFEQTFNSQLNLALQEKSGLYLRPVVENRQINAPIGGASYNSLELLKSIHEGFNPVIDPDMNLRRKLARRAYFYISLIIHLLELAESAPFDTSRVNTLRNLLIPLVDDDFAKCLSWYAIEAIQTEGDTSLLQTLEKLCNPEEYLSDDAYRGFCQAKSEFFGTQE